MRLKLNWIHALRRDESGQALIEAALSLPLFALILIGAAELARVAYAAIEVTNAARSGAEYGGQNSSTAQDTSGISAAASYDGANLTGLTVTSSYACVCSDGSASTCLNTDCSNSHIEESVTVNTSASYSPLFHVSGISATSFTLKGRATQKCAQ
jgi:Flp pilus assembly protein TadG